MADTTPTAAPAILFLTDDVGAEQGTILNDQMTDDMRPAIRVSVPGATASTDAAQAGDTVAVLDGGSSLGQALLTAADITRGYVDLQLATNLPRPDKQALQAQITDAAGNTSSLSAPFAFDLAPTTGLTRTALTDGGYVLSYNIAVGAETHLQRYDPTGHTVGEQLVYGGFGFYAGQYSVTPLAQGGYAALFFSGPHFGGTVVDVVDASGAVLAQPTMAGLAHAVAGSAGGFVLYSFNPYAGDGLFTLYSNAGAAESGVLELAGPITAVTPKGDGTIDIAWNDAGGSKTLNVDPLHPADMANPSSAPNIGLWDDVGPQTGSVAPGGVTDDATPGVRVTVSETGELYLQFLGVGAAATPSGPIQITAADVARGYVEVTPDLSGASGAFGVRARVSDADGLVSPTTTASFTLQTAAAGGQTLQGQSGGSNLQGGAGDDTLIGGVSGPDTMTGAGGADHFTFQSVPWQAAQVTDFTPGTDKLDLSALLSKAGYAGSDPVADGYVKFLDDGQGDTWLYFDATPATNPWGDYVATLQHVAPATLGEADLAGAPASPPPPAGGQRLQAQDGGSNLAGGAGDDTLIGAHGPDTLTGNAGADHFQFDFVPWQAAQITDFTPGADKLDLSALLSKAGYAGSDPVADGYVKFLDDGHGDTWLYFDATPASNPWGDYVATIQHVAPGALGDADLVGATASPPPPPPPPSGVSLQGQSGGSNLQGGAGDDTLIGGTGPDTMSGAGGADHFVYQSPPWAGGEITDFARGVDKIDVSGLLAGVRYAGSDPIADGYVRLYDNGHGGSWLYFDTDGKGTADAWGTFVATLDGVSPGGLTASDFIFH